MEKSDCILEAPSLLVENHLVENHLADSLFGRLIIWPTHYLVDKFGNNDKFIMAKIYFLLCRAIVCRQNVFRPKAVQPIRQDGNEHFFSNL